jgi:hypothetical protein
MTKRIEMTQQYSALHLKVSPNLGTQKVAIDNTRVMTAISVFSIERRWRLLNPKMEGSDKGVEGGLEEERDRDPVCLSLVDDPVERRLVESVGPDLPHLANVADQGIWDRIGGDPDAATLTLGTVDM